MAKISTTGHSAIVHITLQVEERSFKVAQLGPNFLILEEPDSLPPSQGTITLEVDGHIKILPVDLPVGITPDTKRVVIEKVASPHLVAA